MINRIVVLGACLFFLLSAQSSAELKPSEVSVLAVKNDRESMALAAYYVKKRSIPTANVCLVEVGKGETLSKDEWTNKVRPAVRAWFAKNQRAQNIRCIATIWGLPLRIEAGETNGLGKYKGFYDAAISDHRKTLTALVERVEEEANIEGDGQKEGSTTTDRLAKRLEVGVAKMQAGASSMDEEELAAFGRNLQVLVTQVGGLTAMYEGYSRRLQSVAKPTLAQVGEREFLRGRLFGLNEARLQIERVQFPGVEREELLLSVINRIGGQIQSLKWLEQRKEKLGRNETQASFDSELSLVLWPDYEDLGWQTNHLNLFNANPRLARTHPTLMVSRIDAPTLPLAKNLIDTAIQVESNGGLKGVAYLDARGLEMKSSVDATFAFDQDLKRTSEIAKNQFEIETVLNSDAALFQEGECPNAALYCGWYSLAEYVDAFDWQPGSIGYHMASAEAKTLKEPKSQVWCKKMLEDGICATIGPVAEPYLQAFPKPSSFFSLLLSGEHTLVESYYKSKPYNSWNMLLIGDPLYRPYARNAKKLVEEKNKSTSTSSAID